MKKLIAVLAAGVSLTIALGNSTPAQAADEGEVEVGAKIDARLHALLVKARLERQR